MLLLSTSTAAWLHPCSQIIRAKTSMWSIMINEAIPIMPHVQLGWLCSVGASTHSFSCKLTLPSISEQEKKPNKQSTVKYKVQSIAHKFFNILINSFSNFLSGRCCLPSHIFGNKTSAFKGFLACFSLYWCATANDDGIHCLVWEQQLYTAFPSALWDMLSALNKTWRSSPTIRTALQHGKHPS